MLGFWGCSRDYDWAPAAPEGLEEQSTTIQSLQKPGHHNPRQPLQFPIVATHTYRYNPGWDAYRGGKIQFQNGNKSKFQLADSALVPPDSIPWGDDVTISMVIDFDSTTGELQFTFDPHGCQFNTPAMIKLDYRPLNIQVPTLYYIDEKGNYIKMEPNQINLNKKWLKIWVHHFSRYALGRS